MMKCDFSYVYSNVEKVVLFTVKRPNAKYFLGRYHYKLGVPQLKSKEICRVRINFMNRDLSFLIKLNSCIRVCKDLSISWGSALFARNNS